MKMKEVLWFFARPGSEAKTPPEKAIRPTNKGSKPLSVNTANATAATSSFFMAPATLNFSIIHGYSKQKFAPNIFVVRLIHEVGAALTNHNQLSHGGPTRAR
jgi:hypothetical protein